jgi:hypothetical protein
MPLSLSSHATTFEAFPVERLTDRLVRARTLFVALSEEDQDLVIMTMAILRRASEKTLEQVSETAPTPRLALRALDHRKTQRVQAPPR